MDGPTTDTDLMNMILLATGRIGASLSDADSGSSPKAKGRPRSLQLKSSSFSAARRNTEGDAPDGRAAAQHLPGGNGSEAEQQDQPQTVASLLGLTDGVRAKEFLKLVRRLRLIKEDDRKTIQDKLKTSGGATFTLVEKRNLFFGANYRLNESESLTALGPGGARRSADEIRRAASLTS